MCFFKKVFIIFFFFFKFMWNVRLNACIYQFLIESVIHFSKFWTIKKNFYMKAPESTNIVVEWLKRTRQTNGPEAVAWSVANHSLKMKTREFLKTILTNIYKIYIIKKNKGAYLVFVFLFTKNVYQQENFLRSNIIKIKTYIGFNV